MRATAGSEHSSRLLAYAGIFLVAMATLMLEVLLTRILSVASWYHLAFFVISLAMLGMTAGAILVFLRPGLFEREAVPARLAQSALGFAAATPPCVGLALAAPIAPVTDLMSFLGLLGPAVALAVPFVLGGTTLTLALTRAGLPPGRAYGVDLCGASAGCLAIVPLLNVVDPPSAAIAAAAVAAAGSAAFAASLPGARGLRAGAALACAVLLAGSWANARSSPPPLRNAWVKGRLERPASGYLYLGWNTYSRVAVHREILEEPALWGAGRRTPREAREPVAQRWLDIDGLAGTVMTRLDSSLDELDFLAWDVTFFAHRLRPSGPAAVIGVGGGRDVLEAVRAGHRPVVGIEMNELIVAIHRERMADFSGLLRLPGVELVNDEARSFLARDERRYAVLMMSLIDTWAATGAGAYSLSENGLYTLEGWRIFLERLLPDGLFTVSRWWFPRTPGETARLLALALEALWSKGVESPLDHLLLVQGGRVATLVVSASPLTLDDLRLAEREAALRGFRLLLTPGRLPSHPLLRELVEQPSREALQRWASRQELDLRPPTDARPFFFNVLKPSTWLRDPDSAASSELTQRGNLQATQTLVHTTLMSVLLTLLTLIAPLAWRRRDVGGLPGRDVLAACAYFALIGLGFMFVEMGFLSRLNVFLGHPTLALAVLLGGIILFTGIGSLASGRLPVERPALARAFPLLPAALVATAALVLPPLSAGFEAAPTSARIALSLLLLAPPALALGLGFPLGLRLVERMEEKRLGAAAEGAPAASLLAPWLWAINGACGVCATGLALGASMLWGTGTTLAIGAGCYLLLPLCTSRLVRG